MIPIDVVSFLQSNREEQGCLCFSVNSDLRVTEQYGDFKNWGVSKLDTGDSIFNIFPFLVTESFDKDFEIPFFNLTDDQVCSIYYYKTPESNYVILVDKSEIFQITQKYQQYAHDDNISKNKFKRLAEELEKAKQKLNKSNKEKATLIAVLSHELGTPLTSILGYSELLEKGEVGFLKAAKVINRNANDLMMIIENTLQFGRSEANDQKLIFSQCCSKDFFEDLSATLEPLLDSKTLNFTFSSGPIEKIIIDYAKVKQILINLLSNAIKYTVEGGVNLEILIQNDSYQFIVKDTGIGIPKEQQESIFKSWHRVNETETKGAGIGLIISQNLAQSMNGEIILTESSKQGSTFKLTIPVPSDFSETTENENNCDYQTNGQDVLILDDDHDVLELIEMMLSPLDINIVRFQNLDDALKHLESNKVDLIISDYNLGHVSALDLVKFVGENNHDTQVLLMTAMPSSSLKEKYKSFGFERLLSKPVKQQVLLDSVLACLNKNGKQ